MLDRRVTWALIAVAVAARVAAVLVLQSHTVPNSTYEHGEIAANLLADFWQRCGDAPGAVIE